MLCTHTITLKRHCTETLAYYLTHLTQCDNTYFHSTHPSPTHTDILSHIYTVPTPPLSAVQMYKNKKGGKKSGKLTQAQFKVNDQSDY